MADAFSPMPNGVTHGHVRNEQYASKPLVNYKELLRTFLCPVCQNYVSPPIQQCRKGHIICSDCKVKVKGQCPTCKQRFSEVPNIMMEKVASTIAFPCRFMEVGCREHIFLTHKRAH